MKRRYVVTKKGGTFEVSQTDTVVLASEDELRKHLQRMNLELSSLLATKERLAESESALREHIQRLASLLPNS